jgi:hypothetical protein
MRVKYLIEFRPRAHHAKVINRKKVRIYIRLPCHSPVHTKSNFFPVSVKAVLVEFLLLRPMKKKEQCNAALSIRVYAIK